jgi:hypothetical protein
MTTFLLKSSCSKFVKSVFSFSRNKLLNLLFNNIINNYSVIKFPIFIYVFFLLVVKILKTKQNDKIRYIYEMQYK